MKSLRGSLPYACTPIQDAANQQQHCGPGAPQLCAAGSSQPSFQPPDALWLSALVGACIPAVLPASFEASFGTGTCFEAPLLRRPAAPQAPLWLSAVNYVHRGAPLAATPDPTIFTRVRALGQFVCSMLSCVRAHPGWGDYILFLCCHVIVSSRLILTSQQFFQKLSCVGSY